MIYGRIDAKMTLQLPNFSASLLYKKYILSCGKSVPEKKTEDIKSGKKITDTLGCASGITS